MTDQQQGADQGRVVRVRARASGREWTIAEGVEATIRRDPAADIPLDNPKVSRGEHARIIWDGPLCFLVNDGATRGIFVNGVRTARVAIEGRVVVRLGAVLDGEELELETAAVAQGAIDKDKVLPPSPGPDRPDIVLPDPPPEDGLTAPVDDSTDVSGPSLTVTFGSATKTFRAIPGRLYQIGRSQDADLRVDEEQVSRRHLDLVWDGTAWIVTDRSSRGTYLSDQHRLPEGQPFAIHESITLLLGHELSGEPATLRLAGAPVQDVAVPHNWLLVGAGVVAALLLIVGGLTFALTRGDDGPSDPGSGTGTDSGAISSSALDQVKQSVVRLTMVGADGSQLGGGSGTIIRSDGMILTNSHVASPHATGMAAQYGQGWRDENEDVDYLIVGVTTTPDQPAQDLYRATLLASDGYVDLAVVQIYANADGSELTETPNLPALPIGDSDLTKVGDELTVLGFPGAATSSSITVNQGDVSSLVLDPHMNSERAFFESSATVRHGNSGGTAVNAAGELIGVPTRLFERQGDMSYRVRPVNWASEIIAKAEAGGDLDYVSPYVVQPTGNETVTFLGVTDQDFSSCGDGFSTSLPSGTTGFYAIFQIDNADPLLDLYPAVAFNGELVAVGAPEIVGESPHCTYVAVVSEDAPWPDGSYAAVLIGGPDADQILGEQAPFTIGGF